MDIIGGKPEQNPDDFYKSLKEKLETTHQFPEDFLFKFIITSSSEKISEILRVFDGLNFTFTNRESSKAKYTSCNINCFVLDADQVIRLYQEVGKIEGVIML
mgnify:CR=1 FL=1